MKKFVIKNCPANYQNNCRTAKVKEYNCQDCTDCVLKRIIEKCENTQFLSTKNRQDLYAVKVFANDLLQLLDIQEVE